MTKPILLSLFVGLMFPFILSGQYSGFDLSKYKLPDIKTDRLDFNLDLNNVGYKINSINPALPPYESKEGNTDGVLNLSYLHFRNTEKYQGSLASSVYFISQLSSSITSEQTARRTEINTRFSINSENRFYNKSKSFIEVNPYFSSYAVNDRYHRDPSVSYPRDNNEAQFGTSFSIPVLVGKGRIEPVEDARLAIYILEELAKIGKISVSPTDNDIINLASEISRIKRKRFFDSRIKKIRELQHIDSFLVSNNIITSNDISYFAVLNDQWDYAAGPVREAGFSISAGFDNRITFSKGYNELTIGPDDLAMFKDLENKYRLGGLFKMIYAKPINLYWQTAASLSTSYGTEFTRDPEDNDNPVNNFQANVFETYLSYSLQFLPDSRTSFMFYINGEYSFSGGDRTLMDAVPIDFHIKSNQVILNPGLEFYYYVSPRLRIQLDSRLHLAKLKTLTTYESTYQDDEDSTNRTQNNLALTLIYSFF